MNDQIDEHLLTTAIERIAAKSTRFDSGLRILNAWLARDDLSLYEQPVTGEWIVSLNHDLANRVVYPSFSLALDYALKEATRRFQGGQR